MTVVLALTEEQENRLTQAAQAKGVDKDRLLRRLVDGVLDQIAPSAPAGTAPRTPGLHTGRYQVAEDFDAPFPDDFWLGENDPRAAPPPVGHAHIPVVG